MRSAAKPLQALPLVYHGLHTALTAEEVAIACASHTATAAHVAVVEGLLAKAGLSPQCLQCGPHPPLDADTAFALRQGKTLPSALHNNCSGKHAAMLYACRRLDYPLESYLEPSHPLQREILATLEHWGDSPGIGLALDGCGAPTFYLPLAAMARQFAQLATREEARPLAEAMAANPLLVGGAGRVDTALMLATNGRLVAKVGAAGVVCVGHRGLGLGLALKMTDGSGDNRDKVLAEALFRLGWLTAEERSAPALADFFERAIMNTQGKRTGELRIRLPGLPNPSGD